MKLFDKFLKALKNILERDSLVTVIFSEPLQIDGKVSACYIYNISENAVIDIKDDLKAIKTGPIIYDIYWQNNDDTSILKLQHDGVDIELGGYAVDPTVQNHLTVVRSPLSSFTDITSVVEASNSISLSKR